MTSLIPEEDLHTLRHLLARLYGEDIAQDSMVRILSREYRENWFKKEVRWARKKWRLKRIEEGLFEELSDETWPRYDGTVQILAWIELRERCQTSPSFLRLALIEYGYRPLPHNFTLFRLRERSKEG